MLLLVCGRHVRAHLDGHQHVVSIQTFMDWEKTLFRISSIRKITVLLILARVFAYLVITLFLFPDSGLLDLNGFHFYVDLF